jgi:hypothetical protein
MAKRASIITGVDLEERLEGAAPDIQLLGLAITRLGATVLRMSEAVENTNARIHALSAELEPRIERLESRAKIAGATTAGAVVAFLELLRQLVS